MVFTHFRIHLCILLTVLGFAQTMLMKAQCSFTGLGTNYCVYSPSVSLTSTATGGTFSGPGVTGSAFSPSLAGPGTHTITYALCPTSYTITSGTYSPYALSTGSSSSSGSTSVEGTTVSLSDDQITTTAASIGFNFKFFCNTYSSFYISSNGFISFSSSQGNGCCSGGTLPSTLTPLNIITATWTDWNPSAGGVISYTTVGTAPNRKLVVTYNNVPHFASGGGNLTAQIHLYETSNIIEIHTASMVPNSIAHSMGIKDVTGTHGGAVSGRNATSTWTAVAEMYRFTPVPGCSSSQTVYVSPSSVPVSGNKAVCLGDSTALTGSGNTTYTWSTNSNAASVVVTPSSTTTYSVSGTNAFGCVANSAVTVTVNTMGPTVTAVASNTANGICPGTTLALIASGALSYTWSSGLPNAAAFSPTVSNTFTVIGANGCGTSSAAITVSVHPLPLVTAAISSPTVCAGSTVMLTGAGASTYTWSPNVTNAATFTPTASANYSVTGTSALGCTASAVTSLTVYLTPTVNPVASASLICIGKTVSLTASGAITYNWAPANSSASLAVVSPSTTTTYTLVQSNANCSSTKYLTVVVNQLPAVLAIVNPTQVCALNTTTLGGGGGSTYTWTAPGFTTYGFSPVVIPSVSTTYTMAASDGTCVNTTTVFVSVNPNPTISIAASNSSVICMGESATLTASGANNYTWTAPSSTNVSVVVSPTTASQYFVTGDNSYGCTRIAVQVILVNPQPTLMASSNRTAICSGGSATLTAGGTANTYSWNTGQTTHTIVVNPTASTVYTVLATSSLTGCHKTTTVMVNIFTPTITISSNTAVCMGGSVALTAGGAISYTWSSGGNLNSTVVSPSVQTIYTLSATSNSSGLHCPGSNTVQVGIYPNPVITVTANKAVICKGEKAILTGLGGHTYTWSTTSTGPTVQVSPLANTVYTVTGADTNGCVNTGTIQIRFSICSGINEQSLAAQLGLSVYPNPSSGEFTILSPVDLNLELVNELGQIITTITLSELNDHKVRIADLASGIYFVKGEQEHVPIRQKVVIQK